MLFTLVASLFTAHAASENTVEGSRYTYSEGSLERAFRGLVCPANEKEAERIRKQLDNDDDDETSAEDLDTYCKRESGGYTVRTPTEICERSADSCDTADGLPKKFWALPLHSGETTGGAVVPHREWIVQVQEDPPLFAGTGIPERPGLIVLVTSLDDFDTLVATGDGSVIATIQLGEASFDSEVHVTVVGDDVDAVFQVVDQDRQVTSGQFGVSATDPLP